MIDGQGGYFLQPTVFADMAVPFGGYKQSGWGRENGYESLLQYTELKSVVVKL